MSKSMSELEAEFQRLPVKDRAKLIRRLLTTLESENDGDV